MVSRRPSRAILPASKAYLRSIPSACTAFRYAAMHPTGARARRNRTSWGCRLYPFVRPWRTAWANRASRQRATRPLASRYFGWNVHSRIAGSGLLRHGPATRVPDFASPLRDGYAGCHGFALACRWLKQLLERCQPGRVRRPGGRSHQIAVNVSFGPILGDILSSRGLHFGGTCRVRRAFLSFEHACRGKYLRPMTNCRDRLVRGCKMTNHLENPLVQAEIFRCPAAGHDQRIIRARLDL